MIPTRIHPILKEVAGLFAASGREVCLVGGAVRDMLRGKPPEDWDLATDAPPEEVAGIFRPAELRAKVIPTGIKHGTLTVLFRGRAMEITTYRVEAGYSDGRRPDLVRPAACIEEDLARRDFTMNAVALRLPSGERVDPFGGAADIGARLIRCVGRPEERFAEDGLRPLRAVRFAAQLGFALDPGTLGAIRGALETSAKVSAERVRDEFEKMLRAPVPSVAFRLMEETGLLELFLPELAACRGVEQKGFHRFDVLDHGLLACDFAAEKNFPPEVVLAALFHDLGKTPTRAVDEAGVATFHRHEAESERMAAQILRRLRFPRAFSDRVCHLIAQHMFHYTDDWSDAAVRRFVSRVGADNLADLYSLRRADSFAAAAVEPPADYLVPLADRVRASLVANQALSLRDLAVSGRSLMAAGIPAGRFLGRILAELLEAVIEDPELNTEEKLLEIAGRIAERDNPV